MTSTSESKVKAPVGAGLSPGTGSTLFRGPWVLAFDLGIFCLLCFGKFSPFQIPFGNTIVLLLFASYSAWSRGLTWTTLGLRPPRSWSKTLALSTAAGVGIFFAYVFLILPTASFLTGKPIDLTVFAYLTGDVRELWINLASTWFVDGAAEEMIFRGYLLNRLIDFAGASRHATVFGILCSSTIFGLAHSYQGPTGMISSGITGLLFDLLYVWSNRNLWTPILVHGVVDSVFFACAFVGFEKVALG
jgi:membrane protease YdiL (CAAX protease family)